MIDLLPLKPKSLEVLDFEGWLLVLEGSVRSSKTLTANWKWLEYIVRAYKDYGIKNFMMLGVTVGSLKRNVVDDEYGLIALSNNLLVEKKDSKGYDYLSWIGTKIKIYMFGADNVSSYKIFRGITVGGILGDEVNQWHPNSLAEAFNRTIVSKLRLHLFTLNPDVPSHWLYSNYLDKYDKEKTKGYKWFHFTLDDNPVLTEERKRELESQYSGLFYKKFILGLRVNPEGACYCSFTDDLIIDKIPEDIKPLFVQVGVDIGGNGSATTFNATLFYMTKENRMGIIAIKEDYDSLNVSVERVKSNYTNFIQTVKQEYILQDVFVDSAEQLILKSLKNLGMVNVRNSLKKPIVDRIRAIDWLMSQKRFHILRCCPQTIKALQSAVWDSKAHELKRLDNGTTNIDSLDSLEYSIESRIKEFTR